MILNKRDATQRVKELTNEFLNRYKDWQTVTTPDIYVNLPKLTDDIVIAKPYAKTYLIILINISYNKGKYGISVGWSDTLPLKNPNMETLYKSGFWLDYHRTNQETEEFKEPYMFTSLERLHGRTTRKRHLANKYKTEGEFNIIFQDLEEIAVEYWKIMLKRRFDIDANDLTL